MSASEFVGRDNQQRSLIKESPESKQNGTSTDKQSAENAKADPAKGDTEAKGKSSSAEDAAEKKPADRTPEEQQEIDQKVQELKQRDTEVRQHEQAHASVGGQYAGSPRYEFEKGPEGKSYAVGGEVSIDVGVVQGDPQATINKMTVVRRAALAPAQPSAADRAIAAEASTKASQARAELAQQNGPNAEKTAEAKTSESTQAEPAKRSLEAEGDGESKARTSETASSKKDSSEAPQSERRQLSSSERGVMVADYYQRRVSPAETAFSASA